MSHLSSFFQKRIKVIGFLFLFFSVNAILVFIFINWDFLKDITIIFPPSLNEQTFAYILSALVTVLIVITTMVITIKTVAHAANRQIRVYEEVIKNERDITDKRLRIDVVSKETEHKVEAIQNLISECVTQIENVYARIPKIEQTFEEYQLAAYDLKYSSSFLNEDYDGKREAYIKEEMFFTESMSKLIFNKSKIRLLLDHSLIASSQLIELIDNIILDFRREEPLRLEDLNTLLDRINKYALDIIMAEKKKLSDLI
ncbi:hypothetical protein ACFLVN_02325 [Chloroflexota bacterium]